MGMSKSKSAHHIWVIVDDGDIPLEGWFYTKEDAQAAIDNDDVEGHCGPVRIAKYVEKL